MRPLRRAKPLEFDPLAASSTRPTPSPRWARDKALLLHGFAAALRRAEHVALGACDLDFDPARGLLFTVRRC